MEWIVALVIVAVLAVAWSMRGRMRRGEREDEEYNGGRNADPALMEAARQHHGRLW
jgi:type II secretory pathway pseudopilin PulG